MSSSGTPDTPDGGDEQEAELTEEERARLDEAAEQVAAVRAQLAAAPVELVVSNHVMGLYELAAVHLGKPSPDLVSARLAIDALGGVLDACQHRLGEAEATLAGARSQIQLAFVAVSSRADGPGDPQPDSSTEDSSTQAGGPSEPDAQAGGAAGGSEDTGGSEAAGTGT